MQATLNQKIEFNGVGLHSGKPVTMVLHPAKAGNGIVFRRIDLPQRQRLAAIWSNVEQGPLNTKLTVNGVSVATIEHIMAALAGTGVHNVLIDIDGPEVPVLDGSSLPFVQAILSCGVRSVGGNLRILKVLKPVEVQLNDAFARLTPCDAVKINFTIDFPDKAIGKQTREFNLNNGTFIREISDCRTFCLKNQVDAMHANGLALGGSYENAVVVDNGCILSPGGLRRADEAVRHKILDAIGDLYTAGGPVLGRYDGYKSGHTLTNMLLRTLFADATAWTWQTCDPSVAARLPGVGVNFSDLPAVA